MPDEWPSLMPASTMVTIWFGGSRGTRGWFGNGSDKPIARHENRGNRGFSENYLCRWARAVCYLVFSTHGCPGSIGLA